MLHVRFFSVTLLIPNRLIELVARYRFRLFVLAVLAIILYQKDVDISLGSTTAPTGSPATELSLLPDLGAALPTNFWKDVIATSRAELSEVSARPAKSAKRQRQEAYLDQYTAIAVAEMHTSGIPASITLAQALLESNVGQSTLATENQNHFGIKCFSRKCRKGHCSNFSDDSHKDFFRIYPDAATSFRAHSRFLTEGKRYQGLFKLDEKDYKAWAHGLKKAGYATDKRYAEKLIRLIEELELDRYDG